MDNEQQLEEKAEFQQAIRPRDHRVFFGALDHSRLSFSERMMKAVRAPEGDFREHLSAGRLFSPIIIIRLKRRQGYVNKVVAGFLWGYFVTGYYIRE